MLVFPNCKINLGLHIVNKRQDGFHDLETCFYPVPLTDALEIIPTTDKTSFALTGMLLPMEEMGNLCMKTYRLMKEHFPKIGNIKMHLHKVIPAGAGLGGGSSDAAFTIKLLDELYSLNMSTAEMQHFARQVGSDCAFFIKNKPVYAIEKGDKFEFIETDLSQYKVVIVKPDFSISTKEAYSLVKPKKPELALKDILALDIAEWKNSLTNHFEESLFLQYPKLAEIKQYLYDSGAIYASMSGSGSAIYGIFDNNYNVDLKSAFPDYFWWQSSLSKTGNGE